MHSGIEKIKRKIITAGEKAVKELIKVAQEDIIKFDADDALAADRLKNAAATKKLTAGHAIWNESLSGQGTRKHPSSTCTTCYAADLSSYREL